MSTEATAAVNLALPRYQLVDRITYLLAFDTQTGQLYRLTPESETTWQPLSKPIRREEPQERIEG